MKVTVRIVFSALCVLIAANGLAIGDTLQDMSDVGGGTLAADWQCNEWPADNSTQRGFAFVKEDFNTLETYEVATDVTTVEAWWDLDAGQCRAAVERKLELKYGENDIDNERVKITIGVYPSNRYWKLKFAWRAKHRTKGVFEVPGFAVDMEIGDLVMFNDRPPDGQESEPAWEPASSGNLTVMVANIMIDVSASSDDFDVPALAQAFVDKIAQQEAARLAASLALTPTITFAIEEDEVVYTEQNRTPINVQVGAVVTNVQGAQHRAAFEGIRLTTSTLGYPSWIPLPEFDAQDLMYGNMTRADSTFDSLDNPTSFATGSSGEDHEVLVALMVWADNLVPALASDTFTIDTP